MRALLLFLSHKEGFKNFMLRFPMFRKTAWRFVAGETLDDAVMAAREANKLGLHATLDLLGENTLSREDAASATEENCRITDRIRAENLDCYVSVKLTQLGLALDKQFCLQNLLEIAGRAESNSTFVRVDMEDSSTTQDTLDIVLGARSRLDNVGAVVQSYLYRTEEDVRRLLAGGAQIRLCKGAYLEPESVAFKHKRDTDANFVQLMKILLSDHGYHAIATHDEAMIGATKEFAREKNISKDHFEFQMLYGVRRALQQQLAKEGYHVRIYIPYGIRWYPYFMRRLAERPANVFFIARNLLRG